jgi:membrane protein
MANAADTPNGQAQNASMAELVKQLSEQTSRLARQEVELAKAELAYKGKEAGIGLGMFGGAGAFVLYALGALVAAAILGLSTAVKPWLAALIIGAVLLLMAGIAALVGKNKVQQAVPPLPEETTESVKTDVEVAKTQFAAGRDQ